MTRRNTIKSKKRDQQPQENLYLTAVPLDRVKQDALYGVRLARLAWRTRDPEGAAKELGHVRILATAAIRPAPENAQLYRPVDPDDSDVLALADSIREHGIQEALVVSADGWILSGHRRHVAAQLAGLSEVPCRVHPIRREDDPDGFLVLLREFNRQRVKSFEEVVREEVLSSDPEEAYEALLDYRHQQSVVQASDQMVMGVPKARAAISKAKEPMLMAVERVLDERRNFWPLSDRQIHYALLNNPPLIHASKPDSQYRNDAKSYKALTDLLTRARLDGRIPWDAISDPTRPVTLWRVHSNPATFIRDQLDTFLKGYWRDLMRSQPNHIEIVVEKNTVESIIRPVTMEYTIPLTSGRGYCSLPPRRAMAERFASSGKEKLVLLILSDHDPDGEEIASSFARSMRDDFGITSIMPIKVALTVEQIEQFQLPPQMTAKTTSSNYGKFAEKHGDAAYELEALNPADLQQVLRDAIKSVVDRDLLDQEIAAEKADAAKLDALRRQTKRLLAGVSIE